MDIKSLSLAKKYTNEKFKDVSTDGFVKKEDMKILNEKIDNVSKEINGIDSLLDELIENSK